MGRRRAAQNCNIPAWLSARRDGKEGRFIQIGNTFLMSEKTQALSAGALKLYICAAMESGGKREFTFPLSAAKKYGIPPASMRRYLNELIDNGFIALQSSGKTTRESNIYIFALEWKDGDKK